MTAAIALLVFTAGQDRPEIIPPDAAASHQLVREALTLYGVGILRHKQDRLGEAIHCLEEAVRLDPQAAPPRQLLVQLYIATGRPNDAASAAAAVVILDPSQADTWRTLARLLHEMKRTGDAISVLNRCVASPALAGRPWDRIAAYRDLTRLHSALGTHPQAAEACNKALSLLVEQRNVLLRTSDPADVNRERAELFDLLATANLAAGKFTEARDAALEARDGFRKLEELSRADDVVLKLAAAYAGLHDVEKAHTLLDNYLASRPRDVAGFALKARLLREASDGRAALALLKSATDAAPECVSLWVLLGDECRKVGNRERAKAAYSAALQLKADVAAYRGMFAVLSGPGGDPLEMLNLIDGKVKEAQPPKENDNAVQTDAIQRQREAAAEHTRAIKAALRQAPAAAGLALSTATNDATSGTIRDYGTWWLLAAIAEANGQLGTAESLLRKALATHEPAEQFKIMESLIHVLQAARKHEEVMELCELGQRTFPQLSDHFHETIAKSMVHLGMVEAALKRSDEAVKTAAGPRVLTYRLSRAWVNAFAERYDQALDECQQLLKEKLQSTDQVRVRHMLAHVYSSARQYDKAEEQYRLVLELDPNDMEAHNSLGYQLADRGRNLDEAERLIRRALELDRTRKSDSLDDEGENGNYLDSLGWLLFRRGRFAEAKELVERATAMPSTAVVPEIWEHLGDICARMNKPVDAVTAWQRALELSRTEKRTINDPHGAEIERKLKRLQRPD